MATMKTLNGYGFNATELNGKTSDSYLQKTDTASDSAKLGGKAPEYYIHPRNLLDNSDFRNPVNQRGFTGTSLTTDSYGIDRWIMRVLSGGSITLTDGGLELINAILIQNIESKRLDSNKPYATALFFADGTTMIGGSWVDFEHAPGTSRAVFYNITGTITGAVLYEGSYTAETLPPYVPKGYAAELAECQRYYRPMSYPVIPCGNNPAGTQVYGFLPFRMRIDSPTVTCESLYYFKGDTTVCSVSSASAVSYGSVTRISFNLSQSVEGNLAGAIAGNKITINADL